MTYSVQQSCGLGHGFIAFRALHARPVSQNGQVPASVIQSRLDDIAGGQPMGERLDGANEAGVQQKAFGRQRQRFQQATMAVDQSVDIRKRCEDSDIEVTHVLSRSSFAEQYLPRLRHRDDAKRGLVVLRR